MNKDGVMTYLRHKGFFGEGNVAKATKSKIASFISDGSLSLRHLEMLTRNTGINPIGMLVISLTQRTDLSQEILMETTDLLKEIETLIRSNVWQASPFAVFQALLELTETR